MTTDIVRHVLLIFSSTLAIVALLFLLRNELVYRWSKRALAAVRMDSHFGSDMAICRATKYNTLLFDLSVWTFAKAFPALANVEANERLRKELL